MQIKLTKTSYNGTIFNVQFTHHSCLCMGSGWLDELAS